MGKSRKRRTKFQYDRNRRKEWKQSKKLPAIECSQIKDAWDKHKSVRQNLKSMGLVADANQALPIKRNKRGKCDLEVAPVPVKERMKTDKSYVAKELEAEANAPREKTLRLSEPEVQFCTYMLDKYGDDYKAMARDPKNYYQETPKALRAKIRTFQGIPLHYQEYLNSRAQKMETSTT